MEHNNVSPREWLHVPPQSAFPLPPVETQKPARSWAPRPHAGTTGAIQGRPATSSSKLETLELEGVLEHKLLDEGLRTLKDALPKPDKDLNSIHELVDERKNQRKNQEDGEKRSSVERQLFTQLANLCLEGPDLEESAALHALGKRIALTLGAKQSLETKVETLPIRWAWAFKPKGWPGECEAALFHSGKLWVKPFARGVSPDFDRAADGEKEKEKVAVVSDRTSFLAEPGKLHLEVTVLDPNPTSEDILGVLNRVPERPQQRSALDVLPRKMFKTI